LDLRAPVDCEPLVPLAPDQLPDAEHEVALLDDQVSVDAAPLAIVLGFAAKATVGAGEVTDTVFDCVALPPLPVQVSE
jgi:hypothetical protein